MIALFLSAISASHLRGAAFVIAGLIVLTPPAALAQPASGTDCGCTKTGPFVDPAPGKAPYIHLGSGDSAASNPRYRLTATAGGENLPANVSIVRLSDSAIVLQASGTNWGFSPDQDRFLIWWQTGSIFQANLYDLTGAAPNAPIRTFSGAFISQRFRFSDNGRFLLLSGLVSGGAQVQLEYVNAATGDARLVKTLPIPATGSIEADVAGWGYGPDPSRIIYSYLSGGQPMVALDNLDDGSQAPLVERLLGTSAFFQFSPCGDVFGIVNQTAASQTQTGLWRTAEAGAVIGSTTFGSLDVSLATTATKHRAATPGETRDLADNAAADACPVNTPPTADFSISGILEAGKTLTFTDASSDTDGTIVSRSWTFGDGATSSLQNPTHVYSAGGSFDVTLTVTDNDGATASRTRTLTLPLNAAPTADFSINGILEAGKTLTFTDASSDTDGTIASWSWTFGDGATSSLQNPTHVYSAGGAFSVKLTVTDDGGKTANRTQVLPICSAAVVSSGKLLYRTGVTRGDLYALNMGSSAVVRITNSDQQDKSQVGDGSGDADYSPDGSKIAWVAAEQNGFIGSGAGLAVSNADGSGKVLLLPITTDFMTISFPRWTPDGRAIAFYLRDVLGTTTPRHGIYLIDADGSNMRLVHQASDNPTTQIAQIAYPGGFSPIPTCGPVLGDRIPDGCWTLAVGYITRGPSYSNIKISKIQCDGSGVLTSITNGTEDHSPRFSPNGTRIAFSRGWSPETLYVMNADGTAALPVGTHQPNTWDYDPVWSPDGSQIAFTRAYYPNSSSITQRDIIVTNADGCHGSAVAVGSPYKNALSWVAGIATQGTGSISGHVFYGSSLPNPSAEGITVTASWSGGSKSAQTDADGNYTITEIPAGVDITSVSASFPGYVWTSPGPISGGTGYQFPGFTGHAYGLFLGMQPDRYTLNGAVKDPDGNPVPGIVIEAIGQPTPVAPVTTGSDGSFSFDLLRPRLPYTLRPVTAGYDYTPPHASVWGDYGAVLTQNFTAALIVPPAVTPPILFSSDRNSPTPPGDEKIFSIYAAEPDGSGTLRLTRGLASDSMPSWSPDGKKIVFIRQINGLNKLHVMDKDGTGLVNLGIEGEWPAWSPGGTKIAFSRSGRILTADADGTNETQLTADNDRRPAWSRDGKRIAFERTDTQNNEIDIYRIELATGNVTPLLVRPGYDQGPAWSADGQTLAVSFTNFYGDSAKLFTVSADGQTTTDLGVFGTDPTWSPDGRLAYATDASSGTIEVLDIATGDRQAFPKPQDASDAGPAWRVIIAPVENNFDVAVSGNNPWTDSGIDLKVGDQVAITASGSIYFDYNGTAYGPEGPGNLDPWATIDPNLPFQSLVGSVGDPAVISNPAFFEIGGSYNFTASAAGRLWLGVNAADFGYNPGSWGVNIKVTVNPPSGPVVTPKSVNGSDRWTDSGVDYKAGDFVAIVAGGSVNFYYSQYGYSSPYGPDGPGYNDGSASIDPDLPFQSLVGSPGDPLALSPPAFFGIGSACHFRAVADGHLWLGVNASEFANNSGSWNVTITRTPGSVVFEPVAMVANSAPPAGTVGVDYGSQAISITGGSGNFTWSWWNTYNPQYGSTPAGLQLDPATGTISGIPATSGSYRVTIQVHDNVYGMDVRQDFTINVNAAVRMTTLWLPDGVNTAPYSENLNAAYGMPPYTWEIVAGDALPSGLNLVGNTISGTPDASAVYHFAVRVTDTLGTTDRRDLTITVLDPALKIVTAALLPGVVDKDYSQTLQGAYATGTMQWTLNSGSLPPGLTMGGNGSITGQPTKAGRYPFNVRLASGAEAVNQDFSIQIQAPGNIWAWGYGANGQLGTGEKTDRNTPAQVTSSTGLPAAVGMDASSIHSLAVDAAGQAWSWGQGGNGQLGRPATAGQDPFPGKVVTASGDQLAGVVLISAGNLQGGMAVDRAGRLWVWGDNQQGQLGNGTDSFSRNSADVVAGLSHVVAVSSSKSGYHSLAVTADGQVRGWGWNNYGQVGNGDFTPDGSDIHVSTPARVQGLTDIVAVAAGSVHSLALDKFGRVWAWGGNTSGQLGLGTTDSNYPAHLLPVPVPGLSHITAISAGPVYSMALDNQGHLWAWGSNSNGELGLGSVSASVSSPSRVPALDGLVSVSSGSNFVIADSKGSAWTWGRNYYGQLGDGNSGSGHDTATPHSLSSLNGIRAVAGGNLHALALKVIAPGDLNGDGSVNLIDVITALQISTQMTVAIPLYRSADVNGDGKIGLAEVVYIMQTVAEVR